MTLNDFITPLKKWWWLLVIATVVAGGVSYIVSKGQPPIYESRATLMIGQTIDDPNPNSGDLYLEQQLATWYANIGNRETVRESTKDALGLEWLPQYRVASLPNTQLVEVVVVDTVPERAQIVAQEIATQLILQSPSGGNSEDQEFVREQLNILKTQIEDTQQEIFDLQGILGGLDSARDILATQGQIDALQAKLNTLHTNYANLLSTTQQGAVNTLTIIEEPRIPVRPIGPNSPLTAAVAAAVGLALATAGAYLLEFLDKSIKSIDEAVQIIHSPVVGKIPIMPKDNHIWEFVSEQPRSPIAESFRTLRSNLEFTQAGREIKTILVTGPSVAEGKSTVASNLARIIAQTDKKVIFVDADMRKSVIQENLGLEDSKGLSNLLIDQVELKDLLTTFDGDNFILIPAGHFPPNPTELIDSAKFDEVLDEIKEISDIVIVDGPPFIVTDAAILADKADGILIVIQPGRTDKDAITAMMEQLKMIDTPILGIVANRIKKRPGFYTDYYHHKPSSEQKPSEGEFPEEDP